MDLGIWYDDKQKKENRITTSPKQSKSFLQTWEYKILCPGEGPGWICEGMQMLIPGPLWLGGLYLETRLQSPGPRRVHHQWTWDQCEKSLINSWWPEAGALHWSTSRQAYKLDRLNIMGYYKNRGHPASHRLMMAVFAGAGPKKG